VPGILHVPQRGTSGTIAVWKLGRSLSAVAGAALALVSVIVAHTLTSRERRQAQSLADQRLSYLEFVNTAGAAMGR
jgi:hypothetical protein